MKFSEALFLGLCAPDILGSVPQETISASLSIEGAKCICQKFMEKKDTISTGVKFLPFYRENLETKVTFLGEGDEGRVYKCGNENFVVALKVYKYHINKIEYRIATEKFISDHEIGPKHFEDFGSNSEYASCSQVDALQLTGRIEEFITGKNLRGRLFSMHRRNQAPWH